MAVMAVLMSIAVPSWLRYQRAQDFNSSTSQLVEVLRSTQLRAVTEGRTYRVDFTADQASSVRQVAGVYQSFTSISPTSSDVSYGNPGFTTVTGPSTSVFFYTRGTATKGTVKVVRVGGSTRTVTVEGLTGRVSSACTGTL